MTYWGYHLIFTLPLIALLLWWLRGRLKPEHAVVCAVVATIAFVYTTPWDNYAVWLGIWSFGDGVSLAYPFSTFAAGPDNPDGYTWLGHIPFEEYAFFVIETILVCLVVLFFMPRANRQADSQKSEG